MARRRPRVRIPTHSSLDGRPRGEIRELQNQQLMLDVIRNALTPTLLAEITFADRRWRALDGVESEPLWKSLEYPETSWKPRENRLDPFPYLCNVRLNGDIVGRLSKFPLAGALAEDKP
ncbi:hypothetical protein KM043_010160 [Ampulex compressa]|nr:hypothetical protein KM043_010160 [Ampulex compressa]